VCAGHLYSQCPFNFIPGCSGLNHGKRRIYGLLNKVALSSRDTSPPLGAVFVGEHVDRRLGRRAGGRAVNLAKVGLLVDLDR
jgi:hypothetical protein